MKTLATMLSAALLTVTFAVPARAASPEIEGYVWGWQPAAANYFAATGYEYNSAGGPIQISRSAVGTYQVRFHGMAGRGGVAHAGAYGANHLCVVHSWGPSGVDEIVNVRCFNTAGVAVDTRFLAQVSNRKSSARMGYLWSSDPTPPAAGYQPPLNTSYDSAGMPIVVYRSGVGAYQVQLGAFALDSPGIWATGYLRVTPVAGAARHCQVLDPDLVPDPDLIEVRCYDDTGFGVDTQFTLSYLRKAHDATATVNLVGLVPALDGWSNSAGGAPTVTDLDNGHYQISFPGAGVPRGFALGAIMGTPPMFCTIGGWWPQGTAQVIAIDCYDPSNGASNPAVLLNVGFTA